MKAFLFFVGVLSLTVPAVCNAGQFGQFSAPPSSKSIFLIVRCEHQSGQNSYYQVDQANYSNGKIVLKNFNSVNPAQDQVVAVVPAEGCNVLASNYGGVILGH